MPVREDYCTYLTPATHLLALRRDKAEVEQALVKQKEVRFPFVSIFNPIHVGYIYTKESIDVKTFPGKIKNVKKRKNWTKIIKRRL